MKTVEYTLSLLGISPVEIGDGGIQGEHNATKVVFTLDSELKAAIAAQSVGEKVAAYRLEITDGAGGFTAKVLESTGEISRVEYYIPKEITSVGGICNIHLVVSLLDNKNNAETVLYTFPARLRFHSNPKSPAYYRYTKDITSALVLAKQYMEQSASAALAAVGSHNASPTSHSDMRGQIASIDAIARGKANSRVFDSLEEMEEWLAVPDNKARLNVGDNLYIRALNVPDYWWDGQKACRLEAEVPYLSNLYTKDEIDDFTGGCKFRQITAAEYDAQVSKLGRYVCGGGAKVSAKAPVFERPASLTPYVAAGTYSLSVSEADGTPHLYEITLNRDLYGNTAQNDVITINAAIGTATLEAWWTLIPASSVSWMLLGDTFIGNLGAAYDSAAELSGWCNLWPENFLNGSSITVPRNFAGGRGLAEFLNYLQSTNAKILLKTTASQVINLTLTEVETSAAPPLPVTCASSLEPDVFYLIV